MHIARTSLLLVASAAPLFAQKVAEVEPNDSPVTAMPITSGMHITASYATAADEDWYSFSLASPGQVHLHTVATGTLSLGTSRDNRIAIYDATGANRLAWNDGAVGVMADAGVTLPAGSYLARVALKTGNPGTYDLDFYTYPSRSIDVNEAPEPNGYGDTPTSFQLGQTLEGQLSGSSADEDYWRFTLANRGIAIAVSGDDGGIPQCDNLALRFYSGSPGAWTALGASDAVNSQSHRVTTLAHPGILNSGSYAIAVRPGTAALGTAPWDYTKVGKYSLRTGLIDMPDWTIVPENAEPNNSIASPAGYLNFGYAAQGNSTGSLDEDWYIFAVSTPVTIGAMAEGIGSTPLAGSTIRLWAENGTTALASGSGSATTHGRLVFTLERPGVYYISIQGPTVAVTGDYLLHFGGCDPLYITSSTRVEPASTNACIGSTGQRPLCGYMSGETPAFNSTFITKLERALPNSFAIGMIGVSNTLAFGSIPLPYLLDMGGLDSQSQPTPCYVRVDPVIMLTMLTDGTGAGDYSFMFNYQPSALGFKVYQQMLCFDPTLNAMGLSVSNDTSFTMGDRPF